MVVYALFVVFASGLLAIGLTKLFSRRGAWLPIAVTVILPPLLFVPYGLFGLLRDIGAAAEASGRAPPNMIDDFTTGVQTLAAQAAIWLLIALPISIFAINWLRRWQSQ